VDDSLYTLNFETAAGLHSLDGRTRTISSYSSGRRAINMHSGGSLQVFSRGKWRGGIHSGGNLFAKERFSLSIFLELLESVPGAVPRARCKRLRNEQEFALNGFLFGKDARRPCADPSADDRRFAEITSMWR
jgi:hypothetical protein